MPRLGPQRSHLWYGSFGARSGLSAEWDPRHTDTYTGLLSQFYDGCRVRRAELSDYRSWKYRTRLAFALFRFHWQFQYRRRHWSAGSQHRRFQYSSWRSSALGQYHRDAKHRPWDRHARL